MFIFAIIIIIIIITIKNPGAVVHAFNPATWEAEAGRSLSQFQDRQGYTIERPCLKDPKIITKRNLTIRSQACLPSMNPLGIALGVRISYLEKEKAEQ